MNVLHLYCIGTQVSCSNEIFQASLSKPVSNNPSMIMGNPSDCRQHDNHADSKHIRHLYANAETFCKLFLDANSSHTLQGTVRHIAPCTLLCGEHSLPMQMLLSDSQTTPTHAHHGNEGQRNFSHLCRRAGSIQGKGTLSQGCCSWPCQSFHGIGLLRGCHGYCC